MGFSKLFAAPRHRARPRALMVVVAAAALFALLLPVIAPSAASATGPGAGVLTIKLEPVLINTNTPQTTAGNGAPTTIGYNISYSCSVAACTGATIRMSPGPKDPTYDTYRNLVYRAWTAPFTGATLSGDDATGKLITLGNLAAGASGSFPISYNWATSSNSMNGSQFYGNGFPIVMTATGDSTSISAVSVATAAPVIWQSTIRNPTLALSNPGSRNSGTDVQYLVTMNSGCLPFDGDGYPRGDYRYTCAKSFEVIDYLDPRATFVSASNTGVYDASIHAVRWAVAPSAGTGAPNPAPGWYATGSSNGNAPRTVVVNYPAAAFSPSGTDAGYCDFTRTVTNRTTMHMVFLGAGGMADDSNFRDLEAIRTHDIVCLSPFAKGVLVSKLSTYDGAARLPSGASPVVVRPDAAPNQQRWDITVGNQSNVAGRAVISEPNLAIEGTRPYQIVGVNSAGVQQPDASIAWTLNTGTTGTSSGVANAPAGTWFTAATITSPSLLGPNLLATGTAQTQFLVRIYYNVAGNAPVGQTRTNTVTAKMTFPEYPGLPDLDLGSKTHSVQYIAPFGRGVVTKTTNASTQTQLVIPTTGTTNGNYWRINVRNTGNVPGRAIIEDTNLGSTPMKVTSVTQSATSGGSAGTSLTYTLNTGATATVAMPFTAPAGTWITSVRVIGSMLDPVNALETQSLTSSNYEIRLGYAVPSTTVHNSTWTNTATSSMTYPAMGVPDVVLPPQTATVTFVDATVVIPPVPRPTINAGAVGVVAGGGSAVPGRDVTYTVRANSSNIPEDATFSPQYAFIAPASWMIVPGSAVFAGSDVPPGVSFTYKTVVISGITRQAVFAEWPAGDTFGKNANPMPNLTVVAQPTALAVPGSSGVATAWIGEKTNNWTTAQAAFGGAVTDAIDMDGDGVVTEGFATANAAGIVVGSASTLAVIKEICSPDASATDGCLWLSDPSTAVGVDPNATNIKYRLTIRNSGNLTLSNAVGYDVLPYINDVGTSDGTASTPRGSTFRETIGSVSNVSPGLTITYSGSTNPPRPEVYSGATTGSWTAGVAGAQSLRLSYPGNLVPGAAVSMVYTANVLGSPADGAIACNSVAVRITGIGTVSEPSPVCAAVEEADLAVTMPSTAQLQLGRPSVIGIVAKNLSGAATSAATVTVAIPAGLTVTSLTPAGWTCVPTPSGTAPVLGAATVDCTPVDKLPRGVAVILPLEVIPTASRVCLDASIAGPSFDSDETNNEDSRCFTAAAGASGLRVTKTDGVTTAGVGDTLTYDVRVTNDLLFENLTDATVTDQLPTGLRFISATDGGTLSGSSVSWNVGAIAAGSSVTRSVTVEVTDAVANQFVNRVAATASDPSFAGAVLTGSATDTDNTARLTLEKTGTSVKPFPIPGDLVAFVFVVTNTGGATLTGVDISDGLPGLTAITYSKWPGAPGTLAPGEAVTATAWYSLNAAAIDAGVIANTATATGETVDGATVEASGSVDVPLARKAAITLHKTALSAGSEAGDLVTYTFVIANSGNVTLTGVDVADPLANLSSVSYGRWPGATGVLGVGQSVTATASYVTTQADIDRGTLSNTAVATATSTAGAPTPARDTAIVRFEENASLSMHKSAALSGSTITYTLTSQNTGNVTLTGVVIRDPLVGLSALTYTWPGDKGVLAPNEIVTATATYAVSQADIDSGSLTNRATATGITPTDATTAARGDATVRFVAAPNLTFGKTVAGTAALGSVLTYSFTLNNTGNVTLTGVGVADALVGLSALSYVWPGAPGVLAPGQTATATATYTVGQADADRGTIVNTATGTGTPPTGAAITRTGTATVTIAQTPELTLEKSADVEPGAIGIAGDAITYSFVVRNTGNVTLTGVGIADQLQGLSALEFSWPGAVGHLTPGQVATAQASYTITQDDVDRGFVTNEALATGFFGEEEATDQDSVRINTPFDSSLTFSKTVEGSFTGSPRAGDVVTYSFDATNTGLVTLHGVSIADELPGLSDITYTWPGAAGVLAPHQSVTATARYSLTQADIDAGTLVNSASASGLSPGDVVASAADEVTLPLEQAPSATLKKTAKVGYDGWWRAGDAATFGFAVQNTGNVTLTEVVISDQMVGLSDIEYQWPGVEGELAPGETLTATATYALTSADIAAKSLTNSASLRALTGLLDEVTGEAKVTLDAPPIAVAGSGLAFTGANVLGGGTAAALLLGVGILFFLLAQRRKREQETDA
jgi:uncharacterized repeat protein (TIGR01451 family)